MKAPSATFILILLLYNSHAKDIITLNNGMSFQGKIKEIKHCLVKYKIDNDPYFIPTDSIYSIHFESNEHKIRQKYLYEFASTNESCLKGKLDASSFHGKEGGHWILGFLFGPVSMLGTLMATPIPEKGKTTYLKSDNSELFNDPIYISCYKRRARGHLLKWEALGWGSWLLLYFATAR